MRMSKSLATLAPSTDTASPDRNGRMRRRSSLDTFVIRGRTRLPSSKVSQPEPMDLKIAQNLLNAESRVLPRKPVNPGKKSVLNPPKCRRSPAPLQRIEDSEDSTPDSPPKFHLDVPHHARFKPDDPLNVMSQEPQTNGIHEHPLPQFERDTGGASSSQGLELHDLSILYDGPNDISSDGSRNTTSTWTTVSHRNFTSSSAGSQRLGSAPSIEKYNRLATEHGLAEFCEAPDCLESENRHSLSSTSNTRAHHHSWLVRKLLRRTSSTYSIKAKGTIPELRRKRSAYALSTIQPRPRKDILKDRSLEEISRLGGLSILALPHDFAAVDKLVLPSCVSATAHYLVQHGCTAPGIFRVPGQLSTINALYDYYSNRFLNYSNVDDPDKIQSTVGAGDLPAHIEYTVHDVASLLKKILLGLPGGLLGSLSLFKAICGIDTKIQRSQEQSESDFIALKARLIALAISCVTSDHRFSLICAILGLAALIGHESEKAARKRPNDHGPSSELMGYRALGVVLGPLLLGDAVNDAFGSETLAEQRVQIADSPRKSRKQKRESVVEQKLGQNEALLAHVEKAKITAKVGEMLISMWKDVVKQLRDLAVNGTSGSQRSVDGQRLASGRSKFTLSSSEDSFIRGAQPSDVFVGPSESAKRARLPNGHSRPSRGSRLSGSSKGVDWLHDACVTDSSEGAPLLWSTEKKTSNPRQLYFPRTDGRKVSKVRFAGHSSRGSDRGNLLQHGEGVQIPDELILTHPFVTADMTRVQMPLYETQEQFEDQSANNDPMSNYKALLKSELSSSGAGASVDRTWPDRAVPIYAASGQDARFSEPAKSASNGDTTAKADLGQADSISSAVRIPVEGPQEYKQLIADSFGSSRSENIEADKGLLIANLRRPPGRSETSFYDTAAPSSSHRNTIRFLAQRFSQSSQGHYVPDLPSAGPAPMVYANVFAVPAETQSSPPPVPEKDSYTPVYTVPTETPTSPPPVPEKDNLPSLRHSKSDLIRGKESLIPKPVHEIGRGRRKGESRSPSPTKEATPVTQVRQRPSIHQILPGDRLEIAIAEGSKTSGDMPEDTVVQSSATESAPTASQWTARDSVVRKALTTSSMKASSPLDALLMTGALPPRLPSTSISYVRSDSGLSQRDRSPSISQNSDTASIRHLSPASRTNTTNTSALFAEIRRLHRELEKKNDEVNQVRKSLDVVREAGSARERSCSRDGSSHEAETRKQMEFWKRRAEEAERKLGAGWEDSEHTQGEVSEKAIRRSEMNPEAERTLENGPVDGEQSARNVSPLAVPRSPGVSSTGRRSQTGSQTGSGVDSGAVKVWKDL